MGHVTTGTDFPGISVYDGTGWVIRRVEPNDIPHLARLWLEMAKEEGKPDADYRGWTAQAQAMMEAGSYVGSLLQDPTGQTVGFSEGVLAYEPATREIQLLGRTAFIRSPYRGKGLCVELYRAMADIARERGATKIITHGGPSKYLFGRIFPGHEMREYMTLSIGDVG